jgi:hypothetical protein
MEDQDETRAEQVPPHETTASPIEVSTAMPRYFGVTPPTFLFGVATATLAIAIVLAGVVAVAAVLLVAVPFLREPAPRDDSLREPLEADKRTLALAEERDRALSALKELEFDHRTGKLSDADYRELVGTYRRRAAAALRSLEPVR